MQVKEYTWLFPLMIHDEFIIILLLNEVICFHIHIIAPASNFGGIIIDILPAYGSSKPTGDIIIKS